MGSRLPGIRALLAGVAAAALLSGAAHAQTVGRTFDVPPSEMSAALQTYARQAGVEIVWSSEDVRGLRTQGVRGRLDPAAALQRLIGSADLEVITDSSGALTLRPKLGKADAGAAQVEDVVVTGTRLSPEFAGASPVQTVSAAVAIESGLLDSAEILRRQPQVSGPRSQLRYSSEGLGGSYDGGPGTQTIALRGFQPSQTLVLLNGRRLVAAGSEGVPRSPDISLVPIGLVDRFDILTDGASPVYGTDAIAGIVNIRLRQDFEDTSAYAWVTQAQKTETPTVVAGLTTGKTFDRGFIGFGAEYRDSPGLLAKDASFFGLDCPAQYDRDSNGRIRELDVFNALLPGTSQSPCLRVGAQDTGQFGTADGLQFYATPGRSNVGVENWSLSVASANALTLLPGLGFKQFDSDGDGVIGEFDGTFPDPDGDGRVGFDLTGSEYDTTRGEWADNAHFIAPLKQFSLMTYGQYDLNALGDGTAYFEASYNRRETDARRFGAAISSLVSPNLVSPFNPTNPCSIYTPCLDGRAREVRVTAKVIGDGDRVESTIDQYRLVGGVKGDLSILNGRGGDFLNLANWRYDLSLNLGRSQGQSRRQAILKDRLELALTTTVRDPVTGRPVCGRDDNGDGQPDDPSICVPVDLFAPTLFQTRRLQPDEEEFLFGSLDYRSDLDLAVLSAIATGDAISLPAGPVNWVLGVEVRYDRIDASANEDGRNRNFATYNQLIEGGAKGERTIREAFAEVGVPLLRDLPFVELLQLSAAGRVTDEEFTGTNSTYSARLLYRPFNWLTLRSTYGTSFRSPNTYELFLQPFTRRQPLFGDPCVVPFSAFRNNTYLPQFDRRDPAILDQCRAEGVDPTRLGGGVFSLPSADIVTGAATDDLEPETSTAFTGGVVVSLGEPLLSRFEALEGWSLNLSATYYELEVEDQILPASEFGVLGNCYATTSERRYCARITRGADGFITKLVTGFLNGTPRLARGLDYNLQLGKDFNIGDRPFSASLDLTGNYEFEVREGTGPSEVDLSGSYGYAKSKANVAFQLRQGDWSAAWYTEFVGGSRSLANFPSFFSRTCLPTEAPVECNIISEVPSYYVHNASLSWRGPEWAVTLGMNNVFNTDPPRISAVTQITGRSNTLLDGNYDVYGRLFVLQLRKTF